MVLLTIIIILFSLAILSYNPNSVQGFPFLPYPCPCLLFIFLITVILIGDNMWF